MSETVGDKELDPGAQSFISLIDGKFAVPDAKKDVPYTREHEEQITLTPTSVYNECPTAVRFFAARPIPGEQTQAAAQWTEFGGHRIKVHENLRGGHSHKQTDFYIRDGVVYKREHFSSLDDSGRLGSRALLGDALFTLALEEMQSASASERHEHGEPLNPKATEDLLTWLEQASVVTD